MKKRGFYIIKVGIMARIGRFCFDAATNIDCDVDQLLKTITTRLEEMVGEASINEASAYDGAIKILRSEPDVFTMTSGDSTVSISAKCIPFLTYIVKF
jgi:hypothetical protein